jgi:hypothetical protein
VSKAARAPGAAHRAVPGDDGSVAGCPGRRLRRGWSALPGPGDFQGCVIDEAATTRWDLYPACRAGTH